MSTAEADLPVAAVLPDLIAAMAERHAVLVAEPGAGKTTLVPPALLDAPWLTGKIVLLEPRRVIARAAARRIASIVGGEVGGIVGTRMRMDARISRATRIEVVTEGVFARQALDDPELTGIGCVVFDEYHERSLDADFGLALALDIARSLRPDLRLLAMSATIDEEAVARLMDDAAVLRSPGRVHPIEYRHRPAPARVPAERSVADAVRTALAEEAGSILAFLPGRAEVERCAEALANVDADVLPLHGGLQAREQDHAVAPAPPGRRKVVVATPIAESSLTILGVDTVVDSGLVREPVHDLGTGITRLERRRASRASVDQRAGRAGRTGPGTAIRLWTEAATKGLAPHAPPEIVRADLSGLLLDCLDWGVGPGDLSWLDVPPEPALAAAERLLADLGAVDGDPPAITAMGRAMRRLPLPPRLSRALIAAKGDEQVTRHALLLGERGLGGDATDIAARERRWAREAGSRAAAAAGMAKRWASAARDAAKGMAAGPVEGAFVVAHPDRIARARGPARPDGRRAYLLSSGRGAYLEASDPLAKEEWLVACDLTGTAREQRIIAALATSRGEVEAALGARIVEEVEVTLDGGRILAHLVRRLGAIALDRVKAKGGDVPADAVAAALVGGLRERGMDRLPWGERSAPLRSRLAWLRARHGADWPDVSDGALADRLEEWLAPLLPGATSLDAVTDGVLAEGLASLVAWDRRLEVDRLAPPRWRAPTGTNAAIDYPDDGGPPRLAIRVQELFGVTEHPHAGGEAFVLDLLSPARRPIQTTRDLPGFWAGSWADVRRDMRARYPRHPWPEDPASAEPTARAKPRGT